MLPVGLGRIGCSAWPSLQSKLQAVALGLLPGCPAVGPNRLTPCLLLASCRRRSILGGLAAAHDLSGDDALAAKAKDLADRLLPAFDSAPTGGWVGVGGVQGGELPIPLHAALLHAAVF